MPRANRILSIERHFYPFRKRKIDKNARGEKTTQVFDNFQDGTEFGKIIDLYIFDKKLRVLVLDAVERVEVALRVDIALAIGARSSIAHRQAEHVHGNFTRIPSTKHKSQHTEWLERLDDVVEKSKEDFVRHFKETYLPPLPIWVSIETWDFGLLSVFLSGMRHDDLCALCKRYEIARPAILQSWARSLNHVRNICAHHCRLWNRALVDNPARPVFGEMPLHDHWVSGTHSNTRIYSALAILAHFLRYLHPESLWADRMKRHVDTFPALGNPNVSIQNAGFPLNWHTLPLWNH